MAAEAAVSYLVQKLGDALIQKVEFLRGIEEQVQQLKDELKYMLSFLKDAAEKQANDERIRTWISDIREVAHDAEDAIDTFFVQIEKTRSRGPLEKCTCFPGHLHHLNRVGKEIKSIQSRLDEISKRRERYGIENLGSRIDSSSKRRLENIERRRRLAPWEKDKDVVGLREDVESLIKNAILTKMEGLSSATVDGMGGIGKTTLARMVYNHADIVNGFDRRGWVVVSDEFNPKQVIKELILQFLKPTDNKLEVLEIMKELELPDLQQMLHERLKDIRYFIVLDDVWENTHWEALASAFPDEDKGCRLLVTSRNRIITKYNRYVHKMKILNPEESWKLLLKKAFINNTDGKCPPDLEDIGREILEKCDGLPLAIIIAGGLLINEGESRSGWKLVLEGMRSDLYRSAGSTISAILELSYHNLPPELKSCFLLLAFFKEDAAIHAKMLVHIWVTQGVVAQEEIARGYLDELVSRNLVQVKEMGKDGDRVKTCYMHDLLRELSIKKAKEEISLEILKMDPNNTSRSNLLDKPRHLVVDCSFLRNDDDLSLLLQLHHQINSQRVRSLFFHASNIPSITWKSFPLLRLLHCESGHDIILSETIGTLSELRYLGLRGMDKCFLPKSLGRLKNLEVLDLRWVRRWIGKIRSKNILAKMDGLCHIYISSESLWDVDLWKKIDWENIETLKNLKTLIHSPSSCWRSMVRNPAGMTSLRKLGIVFDEDNIEQQDELMATEYLFSSLAMLPNLDCLKLSAQYKSLKILNGIDKLHRLTRLTIDGGLNMQQLPSSSSNFPPNLSHLTLIHIKFEEDQMVVFEKLPKLLYLKLDNAYIEGKEEMVISSHDGFPRLKVLSLHNMYWLSNIRVMMMNDKAGGGISELKRFEIHNCPELDTSNLPERLRTVLYW